MEADVRVTSEGLLLKWSSSSFDKAQSCPRKFQLSALEGYSPSAFSDDNLAPIFGKVLHKCLEQYNYLIAKGVDRETALAYALQTAENQKDDVEKEYDKNYAYYNLGILERTLVLYNDMWKDEEYKTVLIDGKPAVEILFEVEIPGTGYSWTGIIDRIVEDSFGVWHPLDHKTTKKYLNAKYISSYDLNSQSNSYPWALQQLFPDKKIGGLIIDAMQLQVNKTHYLRCEIPRSQSQLEEWVVNTKMHLRTYEHYAHTGLYPMNSLGCELCIFSRLCAAQPEHRAEILKDEYTSRKQREQSSGT